MRHALAFLTGALLVATIATGCGDDGDDVPDSIFDGGTDLDVDSDVDSDTDTDADTDTGTCENLIWEGDYAIDAGADLDGLVSYSEVTGNLVITADAVNGIEELQCLTNVGGDLLILEAHNLGSLGGLQDLDAVGGDLAVTDAPDGGVGSLTNVTLPSLGDVGGSFVVSDHPNLTNISVSNLTATGGDFAVSRNGSLATLTALDIVAINGSFVFIDNDEVEDFDSLYNLNTINGDIEVVDNGALPYCRICDIIEQLSGFSGEIIVSDNISDPCWVEDALTCPE